MEEATNAADASVVDVTNLTTRQTDLQTEYIKNENRVNDAKGTTKYRLLIDTTYIICYIFKKIDY